MYFNPPLFIVYEIMINKYLYIHLFLFCFILNTYGQETFPVNGVRDSRSGHYFFKNATLYIDYQTKIENGQLLIEKGRIKAVGENLSIPKGAVEIDLEGKTIYPSFIDIYADYALPQPPPAAPFNWGGKEQITSTKIGVYNANEAIKSNYQAVEELNIFDKEARKKAKKMRSIGFGTVLAFKADGIARGTGVLTALSSQGTNNEAILKADAATFFSLNKGSSKQTYPISVMGAIALLRQTYYDAKWYNAIGYKEFKDLDLQKFNTYNHLPKIVEAKNWLDILRLNKVGQEFGEQYIIKSNGTAYQRIKDIKKAKVSLIVPLNFPSKPNVNDVLESEQVSYTTLKHWELAATNPGVLAKNQIPFAFTMRGLKNKKDFLKNLQKALKYGLSKREALKALTYTPAHFLKMDNEIGSLKTGAWANFIITSGDIFDKETKIIDNWVQGKVYVITKEQSLKTGIYKLDLEGKTYKLSLKNKIDKLKAELYENEKDSIKIKVEINQNANRIYLNFELSKKPYRLSGWVSEDNKKLSGQGQLSNGKWLTWKGHFEKEISKNKESKPNKKSDSKSKVDSKILYPFTAFGHEDLVKPIFVLFKNATVWTNEQAGVLKQADVLVKNGKIIKVGQNLEESGAQIIDASGKHLTSGIIDEHSHIALTNVNDVATVSAMCRMSDAVDPTDIDIYRQLAGGVTTSQLLHGSANPVGGQSAIIKMRWGANAEDMLIKDANKFIKFALGENVKRSRNVNSIRYPQTRMGVEQVYQDIFSQALEYDKAWKIYNDLTQQNKRNKQKNKKSIAPRKDLVLQTIAEIINKDRFITCHSYVQSEINMLMKVAESYDFKINTFTHILEGYKVADKMKKHGAGASTFSDWWAYKEEVKDAIPYNASLMTQAGVVSAINSDDAEMGRRLNQEAAKSVKYGGLSEEEAWKLVTLNPAKLLHLDDKLGSIKVGKDADLVLWTDNPLSIYAKVEMTLVDGCIYYDRAKSEQQQLEVEKDRARIINKIIKDKNGKSDKKIKKVYKPKKHCDTIELY